MKQHKFFFTVLALVLTTGILFAFQQPVKKDTKPKTQTVYWFNVNGSGAPTTVIGTDPSMVCPEPAGDLCAKAYNESQTTGSGSERTVIPAQVPNQQGVAYKE